MKKFYAFALMAAIAAGAMADEFVTDGTGTVYTFNSLSQIEGTGVTLQNDGSYLVSAGSRAPVAEQLFPDVTREGFTEDLVSRKKQLLPAVIKALS